MAIPNPFQQFNNRETVQGPAMPKIPQQEFMPPSTGTVNLRNQAVCDYLNRGLSSNLFSLTAHYRKMRIPIRYLTPIENNWIECVIADESGETEDDARVVIKDYTVFTMVFGKEDKRLA
jgi:hypothetical protein